MSNDHPPKDAGIQLSQPHGSVKSYSIGFTLSLLFTLVPYYMVVNQLITGAALLIVILGFAVLQLIVQVLFFLHLGQGPKPNWNLNFFISTIVIMLIVVGGSIFIINNLIYNMLPSEQAKRLINDEGIAQIEGKPTGACEGQHTSHLVTVTQSQIVPNVTIANKCDSIIFVSENAGNINIIFGAESSPKPYAGERALFVTELRSNSVILSEPGTYQLFIEQQPQLSGSFVVAN